MTLKENDVIKKIFFSGKLLIFIALWGCYGCSSTKFVPEGEYLFDKVKIESDVPGYKRPWEVEPYLNQRPNYKMFGLNKTMMQVYNLSGKNSNRWHNRVLRKIGEAPVIFDSTAVEKTVAEFERLLVNAGYVHATVSSEVHLRKKKADVVYKIVGNTPYRINNYQLSANDYQLPIADESSIKKGDLFNRTHLDAERNRLTTELRNQGYYAFTKDNIMFDADSTQNANAVDLELKFREIARANVGDSASSTYFPFKKYYFDKVKILVDYDPLTMPSAANYPRKDSIVSDDYTIFFLGKSPSLRPKTLVRNTFIASGQEYSQLQEDRTYSAFSNLHALSNIHIRFNEKMRNDSLFLDATVLTMPTRRQGISFSVEGTNTAGDLGVASSANYTHRNLFRGSEMLRFSVRGAYETMSNFSNPYWEFGTELALHIPKFIVPFSDQKLARRLKTATEFSVLYNYQTRPEYDRILFSGSIGYNWQNRNKFAATHRFDLLNVDYIHLPRIDATFLNNLPSDARYFGYTDQFIVSMDYSFLKSTFDPSIKQHDAYSLRLSVESSGNVLYSVRTLLGATKNEQGSYKLFDTYFAQFLKGDFDFSKTIVIDPQNSVAWRIGGGIGFPYGNSDLLPFEKRYYSGGANSVRAWSVRELGPGAYVPNSSSTFFNQSGDIKLDLNVEYRTRLFWKLEAAAFVDAGNIWTIRDYEGQAGGQFKFSTFWEQIAVGYGLGLRLDLDYFLVRLDAGEKAYDPSKQGKDRWTILHPNFHSNFAWHIAVGYPF
ncbi:membrane protein [Bacteroidia bacterium]|nr:membrane protein [Bacteroidia bacterium]